MSEPSLQKKTEKTGNPKIFEEIRRRLPLRGAPDFDPGVSAMIRRLDAETEFAAPALVRVLVAGGVSARALREAERARAWAAVGQALALMAHADLRGGPKKSVKCSVKSN